MNTQSKAGFWLQKKDGTFLNDIPFKQYKSAENARVYSFYNPVDFKVIHLNKNGKVIK